MEAALSSHVDEFFNEQQLTLLYNLAPDIDKKFWQKSEPLFFGKYHALRVSASGIKYYIIVMKVLLKYHYQFDIWRKFNVWE